jgi:hypothetical protein
MEDRDRELARRVRDVIAVVADDIDSVVCEVEDGVAYVEGVVPSEEERRAISRALRQVDGLDRVITCLATEKVLETSQLHDMNALYSAPVMMHYHSSS